MKGLTTNPQVWKILGAIFAALTIVIAICFYFRTIFITIIIGVAMIIITEQVQRRHAKDHRQLTKRQRRFLIIGLTVFWIVALVILLGQSVNDLSGVFVNNERPIRELYVQEVAPRMPGILQWLGTEERIRGIENAIFRFLANVLSQASSVVFNSVLIVPLLFYMYFRRRKEIERLFTDLIPSRFQKAFQRAGKDIGQQLHDFFSAKVVESIIIGGICCFGFYVSGLKGWLILGIVAGFLNIVPYLGPILGAIPPLLVGLLDDPLIALFVLITIVIAQLIDNLYLIPFMISDKVRMDPLLSILLILVGARVFGVMGMLFAIPIFLVYKTVLREGYRELVKIYD